MEDLNKNIFTSLFKEVCEKCFGFTLTSPLSEADSKLLSNKILEQTGLVIGAKTIRNYSLFVLHSKEAKKENPSVATLDTLARYLLDAPYTDEARRKNNESHYPYWFQYRSRFSGTITKRRHLPVNFRKYVPAFIIVLAIIAGFFTIKSLKNSKNETFTDNFNSVHPDSLKDKGWIIKSIDSAWWNKRDEMPGHLSLYTLKGDNWANDKNPSGIKNLVMKKIFSDCFIAEVHLSDFIPAENWQQAGILLSEDTTFTGKALRLSISYNDFFGGYEKPPEIIIQAVSSSETGSRSKPEEIAHVSLFSMEPGKDSLVHFNLAKSALKIEKKANHFRFLYTTGSMESFAFKEVVSGDFNINPRYISLFAIKGWAEDGNYIPARFDSFVFTGIPCNR